ncbi:unnamed protein product, partial [marine sediment metagenome]
GNWNPLLKVAAKAVSAMRASGLSEITLGLAKALTNGDGNGK